MKLAILGSGFIPRFYAGSLVAQRRKDVIVSVYSRTEKNAIQFAEDYTVLHYSTSTVPDEALMEWEKAGIGKGANFLEKEKDEALK